MALVTNAHYKTLSLKMNHTGLLGYFDEVISSFDLGNPKEEVRFWEILHERLRFDPNRALLVDDNAEALAAARPSASSIPTSRPNPAPARRAPSHPDFPSIESFKELMG